MNDITFTTDVWLLQEWFGRLAADCERRGNAQFHCPRGFLAEVQSFVSSHREALDSWDRARTLSASSLKDKLIDVTRSGLPGRAGCPLAVARAVFAQLQKAAAAREARVEQARDQLTDRELRIPRDAGAQVYELMRLFRL